MAKYTTYKNGINDDLVKSFTLSGIVYEIHELNTRRGKPYFLEAKWTLSDGRKTVEDIGYFATVQQAETKAKKHRKEI